MKRIGRSFNRAYRIGLLFSCFFCGAAAAEFPVPDRPGAVAGSEVVQAAAGLSGAVTLNITRVATGNDDKDAFFDAFFYKRGQFVFGRRGDRLYFNFNDGKRWAAYIDSDPDFKLEPGRFYQLGFSIRVHRERSQGELWTDVALYADGREVGRKRVMDLAPADSAFPVECGQAASFGEGWGFAGTIAAGKLFDRELASEEFENLALAETRVKPAFEVEPELPAVMAARLDRLAAAAAQRPDAERQVVLAARSALETLARRGMDAAFDRSLAALEAWPGGAGPLPARFGALQLLPGCDSLLILAVDPTSDDCRIAGWYDLAAGRDMLDAAGSDWWTAAVKTAATTQTFSARTKELKARLAVPPVRQDGVWRFAFVWTSPELAARADFTFEADRLAYELDLRLTDPDSELTEVGFPAVKLRNFDRGNAALLTPAMSGALLKDAVTKKLSYSGFYPTGHVSMQLGAWYDAAGGVYFCAEDGRARAKSLSFRAAKTCLAVRYGWPVARPEPGKTAEFSPGTPAVLELFRGDWYDAGLLYRKFLETSAVWFKPDPARRPTPAWLKENTLWLYLTFLDDTPEKLIKLRNYFGLPFAVHYYNWIGQFDRDYPHCRANPESYLRFRFLKSIGIRVVPYTNGRLWETLDRRDEDFEYTKFGVPNAVKARGGAVETESYSKASFAAMCPATPLWQQRLFDLADYVIGLGTDGIYFDQIAAARPRLCFDPAHPHRPGDGDSWYMGGYRPLLTRIRVLLAERYPDAVLTSEDNAEPYVDLMDGLLAWRWMYDGYVPLFILCYGNRVEFVGRAFGGEDEAALPAKIANQLVNGEQLGWCGMGYMAGKGRGEFRRAVKRAMYARRALLDYFHDGMPGRPVEFEAMAYRRLRWGNFGTQVVGTPAVESGAYRLGGREVLIFVNTTGDAQHARIVYRGGRRGMSAGKLACYELSSVAAPVGPAVRDGDFTAELRLEPGEIRLFLVGPAGDDGLRREAERLGAAFETIAGFRGEPDPFD
jgi:hypothetical protein